MPHSRRSLSRSVAAVLAASVLALSLTACSSPGADDADADERPVVLTTFTVLADIAANVAGEHLQVESITKVGAEIHGYEPTPGDIRRAAGADLIIDNGMNLEAWFTQFVADLDVPHVVVSEGVEPLDISDGASTGLPNPHAWMSPVNNQRALVTCEGAFSYLARDAGLTEKYIWAVNAEQQATPKQIASAIDFVRENDVPAVFCESTVSNAPMLPVVDATDATFGGTLYVDSLSDADGPVPTYLDLMRHDAAVIIDALTGQP